MAASPAIFSVNASQKLAEAEIAIDIYESDIAELQNIMDGVIGLEETEEAAGDIRILLNLTRAKLGFWRGEASFWRNEVNENKTALKDTNKLATSN